MQVKYGCSIHCQLFICWQEFNDDVLVISDLNSQYFITTQNWWQKRCYCSYLSKSTTISQCLVWGKRSTAVDFTGWNGSDAGRFLTLLRACPKFVVPLKPPLAFTFSGGPSFKGMHNSTAFASKLSGLQDMYLQRSTIQYKSLLI